MPRNPGRVFPPAASRLSEVPGAPHYFDGVMNGDDMAPFLDRYATADASRPAFPGRFTAVTLNPASSGSRGTVHIYQLRIPFRCESRRHASFLGSFVDRRRLIAAPLTRPAMAGFAARFATRFGRVHVEQEAGGLRWTLRTENVRRFALQVDPRAETLSSITLDGQTDVPLVRAPAGHYCRLDGSTWTVCYEDAEGAWTLAERSPTSSGPILQVWDRPTVIIVGTLASPASAARYQAAASVIASDYFHYSLGKAPILTDVEALNGADLSDHNLILLGGPATNAFAATLRPRLPGGPLAGGVRHIATGGLTALGSPLVCARMSHQLCTTTTTVAAARPPRSPLAADASPSRILVGAETGPLWSQDPRARTSCASLSRGGGSCWSNADRVAIPRAVARWRGSRDRRHRPCGL